ncbi:MAG: hypothetical protein OCU18_06920 [Candidatus Syntrophoarchaeum sp.]|nr:hypothetical protein [Candidatus Syntrophoarchaeum sp.]
MKKRVVITDLSRMEGDRVCIFGIDEERRPIRPVISYRGIRERDLFDEEGNQIIKPFAEVEFDFLHPLPKPPHTEDWEINTIYKPRLIKNLSEDERKVFLEEVLDGSVKEIFGAVIHENRYINPWEGERSLGTVKAKEVLFVRYSMEEEGKCDYRIRFSDMNGDIYNLKVTDCAFRRHCDLERIQNQKSMGLIGAELQRRFNQSKVYLRVGLARLFKDVYWLQISGVHTFPDHRV